MNVILLLVLASALLGATIVSLFLRSGFFSRAMGLVSMCVLSYIVYTTATDIQDALDLSESVSSFLDELQQIEK